MKNVQISQELFMKLLRYHLLDDDSCADDVKKMAWSKKIEHYGGNVNYIRNQKSAPTEEEREKARQEYLDRRGIQADFRW